MWSNWKVEKIQCRVTRYCHHQETNPMKRDWKHCSYHLWLTGAIEGIWYCYTRLSIIISIQIFPPYMPTPIPPLQGDVSWSTPHTHTHTRTHTYTCTHTNIHAHTHIHTHAHTHAQTHRHAHTCIYTQHIYIYTQVIMIWYCIQFLLNTEEVFAV